MQKIYNEGRVVGLSAYEIYVRHSLSEYPDEAILTEREWLAATLGDGVSMILKIAGGTTAGIYDYPLPGNSTLCAANTITASLFNGTVEIDKGNKLWATKVTSYGPLIDNSATESPTTPGETSAQVPSKSLNAWDKDNIHMLRDYLKVIDGVTFQPGTWTESGTSPKKNFVPDLSKPSVVRLRISKTLESDLYILLTGFLFRPIVAGLSKMDTGSLNTERPQNGDFLGVEVFPWSNKVVFTVPSEVYNAISHNPYIREFVKGKSEKSVDSQPVIDFESADPKLYYVSNHADAQLPVAVTDMNIIGEGASVLATYQRSTEFPPVLYGAKVSAPGDQKMSPIDIAAPGNVKVFTNRELARTYLDTYPGTYSIVEEDDGDVFVLDGTETEEQFVPITTKVKVENLGTSSNPKYAATTIARDEHGAVGTAKAVSLLDPTGEQLNTDGTDSSLLDATTKLNWTTLLNALANNKSIELLGAALRAFRSKLPNIETSGVLKLTGTGENQLSGSLKVAKAVTAASVSATGGVSGNTVTASTTMTAGGTIKSTGGTLQSGTQYVTLKNGLRLYISNTVPTDTDIPDGSIGIGW